MRRLLCLAAAVTPPLLLAAAPAYADDGREVLVGASAWSWRQTLPGVEPSNVPSGDLAVQFDGTPDATPAKATYLRLDLPSVAAVSTLRLVAPARPGGEPGCLDRPARRLPADRSDRPGRGGRRGEGAGGGLCRTGPGEV